MLAGSYKSQNDVYLGMTCLTQLFLRALLGRLELGERVRAEEGRDVLGESCTSLIDGGLSSTFGAGSISALISHS